MLFNFFLPRCMHCMHRDLARKSCPSVCLSVKCIVTKQKKVLPTFYVIWKIIYPSFLKEEWLVG